MARQIIDCTRWIGVNGQDDGAEALTFECGDSRGDTARLTRVLIPPGAGTYIVGQLHSDIDGLPLSELDIQCFFGEGVIAKFNFSGPGSAITAKHLQDGAGELIRAGDILLLANAGDRDSAPILSAEAARWMINRRIKMVGFDESFAIERPRSLANHRLLSGAGIAVVHNLINLDRIAVSRVAVMALPLAIANCASAPCRVVVLA